MESLTEKQTEILCAVCFALFLFFLAGAFI